MKKILSLLLAFVMLFSLVGCSNTETETGAGDTMTGTYWTDEESGDTDTDGPRRSSQRPDTQTATPRPTPEEKKEVIAKDGHFFDKKNVALYIHTYGTLPENFITKDAARDLGWEGGNVEAYAPGCAIGGDKFGNHEGLLPKAKGRVYYECDIDTDGYHSRGSRRIVFSNDGLIYYTHDHYESFELLYGEE